MPHWEPSNLVETGLWARFCAELGCQARAARGEQLGSPASPPTPLPGTPLTPRCLPRPPGMSYKELDERLENDPNIIVCWK